MDTEVVVLDDADVGPACEGSGANPSCAGAGGRSCHDASAGVVTGGNELAEELQRGGCAKIPSVSRIVAGAGQRGNEATPSLPRRWGDCISLHST